jgi:hypothetical protein
MDTLSNYNCVLLKNHKGITTLIWIVNVFGNRFHYLQSFNVQNLMQFEDVPKVIFNIKNLRVNSCFFLKQLFSLYNVHHSFSRLKRIWMVMIKRTKIIEIGDLHFYNSIQHFWFKHVFNHRNHKFWRCVYRKCIHF